MDINNIAALATQMAQQSVAQEASIRILKKTLDIAESNALQLIAAIPTNNLPANLGNHVNTKV